jgi:hypothetical protein
VKTKEKALICEFGSGGGELEVPKSLGFFDPISQIVPYTLL